MATSDRETELLLKAQDLTAEAFAQVQKRLQGLRDETQRAKTSLDAFGATTGTLKTSLTSLAGAVGVGFSVGAVASFGKSVFDVASMIGDTATKLAISTNAAQGFKYAAEQSGSSLEAVSTALNKMNANLDGGDKSTVNALREAGLNFADIRNMKPEDAFLTITDAIQRMPDPMQQSAVALALFGKSAGELLPAIKEGFRGVSDSASKMSEETVRRLKAAEDAWNSLYTKVVISSGEIIAKTLSATKQIGSSWGQAGAFLVNAFQMGAGPAVALASALDEASTAAAKNRDINLSLAPARRKSAEELAAEAAALKKWRDELDAAFRKFSGAEAAEQVKVLDITFRRLADSGKITQRQLGDVVAEAVKLAQQGAVLPPRLWDVVMAMGALNPKVKAGADGIAEFGQRIELAIPEMDAFVKATQDMQGKIKLGAEAIGDAGFKVGDGFDEGAKRIEEDAKKMAEAAKRASEAWQRELGAIENALGTLADAFSGSTGRIIGDIGGVVGALRQASAITMQNGAAGKGGILTPLFDKDASAADKWAASISAGATIASGAMNVWTAASAAGTKGAGALSGALAGAKAGAAFGPYGAAIGAAAGAVVGFVRAMSAGRREVESFAKSMGGFDQLQKTLLDSLGKVGEDFWITLTQKIKKGDKAGADKVIAEIQTALANAPNALAAAAGYQTKAELQGVADKAKQVYEYLRDSGKYTASQIADAFAKMQAAQDTAMDDTARKAKDAAQAARDAAQKQIDGLNDQIKTLQDSIANEAPEEVMGIVEAQARAQITALERQRDEAAKTMETLNQNTADGLKDVADALNKLPDEIKIRVQLDYQNGGRPGGSSGSGGEPPSYDTGGFIARDQTARIHAGELIGPVDFMAEALAGALRRTSGGGDGGGITIIKHQIDGRTLTETVLRNQSRVLASYGGGTR